MTCKYFYKGKRIK